MAPLLPLDSDSNSRPQRNLLSKVLRGTALGIGVTAIAGTTGAVWWGWNFIQSDLAPVVQKDLQGQINRPLQIGELQSISWGKVNFGPSQLPAYSKQVNGQLIRDEDKATVESIEIDFNPAKLLLNRQLDLEITLNRPKVFLDEAPDSQWVDLNLSSAGGDSLIETNIKSIKLRNGSIQLSPQKTAQRTLTDFNGELTPRPDQSRFDMRGKTKVDSGGAIAFKGQYLTQTQRLKLETKSKNLNLPPLVGILPTSLPFKVNQSQLTGDIDLDYHPNQPLKVKTNFVAKGLELYIPTQELQVNAEQFKGKINLFIHAGSPVELTGDGTITNGIGSFPEDLILSTGRSRRQTAKNVNGTFKFLGEKQRFRSNLTSKLPEGGTLKVTGITSFVESRSNLNIRAQGIPAPLLDQAFKIPMNVSSGKVDGNITIKLNKGDRPSVQGIAQLRKVNAQLTALPQSFREANGYIKFQGITTTLDNLTANYGNIPIILNGLIDPDVGYDLQGRTQSIEANQALKTIGVSSLPFPVTGSIVGEDLRLTGKIDRPIFQGKIQSTDALTFDQVPLKSVSANFRIETPTLNISEIQAEPQIGGKLRGTGQYSFIPNTPWVANLDAQDIPGNALASLYSADPGFELGTVSSQTKLEVLGDHYKLDVDFKAPDSAFPTIGNLVATPGKISLNQIKASIPGGQLLANGTIIDGQIALTTELPGLNLSSYSEELRGKLVGQLKINSPLIGLSSASAIAQGNLRLTEGISLIEAPIDARIRWNGQHIEIQEATAPNFYAQGIMGAKLQGANAPQLTTLNLEINQRDYALASLPFELPANSKLSGSADLQGTLYGEVYSPTITGDLQVYNLVANDLPFEPKLTGSLNYDPRLGLDLKTKGNQDQANLALNANQELLSFQVKNQNAIATGKTIAPNQLAIDVDRLPLTALNWDVINAYGYGNVSGTASGNFLVSLPTYNLSGPLKIENPAIGTFRGDRFAGQFLIQEGVIAVKNSQLNKDNNQFLIDAQLIPDTNPKFSGNITVANAQIEDAIVALETLNFIQPQPGRSPYYGRAADLNTTAVGQPQAPILIQLQRLAEINQLRQKQNELEANIAQIPSWTELTGAFKGKLAFQGSAQTGIESDFSLESNTVNWASLPFEQVIASGSYGNNGLKFSKLSLNSNGGNLAFQGQLGQANSGTLNITKLPLGELSTLLAPSLPIEGYLDANATLGGSFSNPNVIGSVQLSDATINQSEIQNAKAQFNFQQARLSLAGMIDLKNPDPIRFEGSIPYQFPFMTAKSDSDELSLKLQVKNEGLSLINLFTDQVSWINGQGEVDIAMLGTLQRPSLRGRVIVNNATLNASTLPAPLTKVSGELNFDQERVQVNRVRGEFSEGELKASGVIPLFSQEIQNNNAGIGGESIFISLKDIALDVKGLYKGGVNGDLKITGSIIEPIVGGMVSLDQGQIVLSDATALSGNATRQTDNQPPAPIATPVNLTPDNQPNTQPLQFNNLVVRLNDQVKILQPPLLNFTTQGELTVNGSIDSPRPEGVVSFTKGEVNLFTAFFKLNKRKQNFAAFSPRSGLDPYLNINLITTLTEANSGRSDRLNEFADPLASTLGSIESVRINAAVDGRASQLLSNFEQAVELTSNPTRSEGEIIALLSGGIAEAIQDGNADLALVNIASSTVLNRVQSYVDDAFGGRAVFRLFPILIPTETDRSVLAFGGEFGYDVTNNLSLSVLQVLTGTNDPTLFNISYDINEKFRARGSVSTEGEATGLLEYRFRF